MLPLSLSLFFLSKIVNAPNKSHKARLVALGDKLYNLRDLTRSHPDGWDEDRVHEYFVWASKVGKGVETTPIMGQWVVLFLYTPIISTFLFRGS